MEKPSFIAKKKKIKWPDNITQDNINKRMYNALGGKYPLK